VLTKGLTSSNVAIHMNELKLIGKVLAVLALIWFRVHGGLW
jgi:hypothetical protein